MIDKINTTKVPEKGTHIYVGGLGEATVTDDSDKNGIPVTYICEEDGTLSYQLHPDEGSDIELYSVNVIPLQVRFVDGREVHTTEKYWDCECEKNYIHPKSQEVCDKCGSRSEDQPDSRVDEVNLMNGETSIKDLIEVLSHYGNEDMPVRFIFNHPNRPVTIARKITNVTYGKVRYSKYLGEDVVCDDDDKEERDEVIFIS